MLQTKFMENIKTWRIKKHGEYKNMENIKTWRI
jgi:hypothetical protein